MKLILLNDGSGTLSFLFSPMVVLLVIQLITAGIIYGSQGKFEGQTNVGKINHPGSVKFDKASNIYRINRKR